MEENSSGINEMGPNHQDISQTFGAENRGPLPEDVKISSVLVNSEVPSQNGAKNLESRDVPSETVFMKNVNGRLGAMEKDVCGYTGHLEDEDSGTPDQAKKGKAKLRSPVTSSRILRSISKEKPKAPEPSETMKQDTANGEKKNRERKKKRIKKKLVNEFSRTKARLGYLLHRIKYEQSLIDAYSAEGWKGQSLEKLKPEKELQRAKSHILSYKLRIRDLFQHLESSLSVGKLPESLFDSKGEIDSEDIFCAKCGSKELPLDNDIILCDGACERGFHQFCLEPPLLKDDIPPGDESWLCPGCDCKAYCIDMLNDYQGINVSIADNWVKVFPEAAASASGKKVVDNFASSSNDSEDDDYDPDKPDTVEKVEDNESSSDESNYFSASDDLVASPNNEDFMELPSDNSEDDDFDPTAPDPDKQVKQDSSTSDFTSDSEDLRALLDDATVPGNDPEPISPSLDNNQPCTSFEEEKSKVGRRMKRQSLKAELSYLMESFDEPVYGKRQRERLDYEKLHNVSFFFFTLLQYKWNQVHACNIRYEHIIMVDRLVSFFKVVTCYLLIFEF
ncbi:hypothetical protein ACJIZ3_001283 [Penstemon smallii]|uniref:PHD-type domain-containing protein n=1 Tax=Penstemon smallii TaxID=265156 RepID=A0ABD3U611_9LAMI